MAPAPVPDLTTLFEVIFPTKIAPGETFPPPVGRRQKHCLYRCSPPVVAAYHTNPQAEGACCCLL